MPQLADTFKPGDLLYGVHIHRVHAQQHFQKKHPDFHVIVDTLNDATILQTRELDTAQFAAWLKSSSASENSQAQLKQHFTALAQVPYKKLRLDYNHFPASVKNLDPDQRRIRRACKARLLDASTSIHFILEGIDINQVFDRAYSLKHSTATKLYRCKHDSYTSTELRFVLKHYDELNSHVSFYRGQTAGYQQVDLFQWLKEQTTTQKTQLRLKQWVAAKQKEHKIVSSTVEQLQSLLQATIIPPTSPTASKKHSFQSPSKKKEADIIPSISLPPATPHHKKQPPAKRPPRAARSLFQAKTQQPATSLFFQPLDKTPHSNTSTSLASVTTSAKQEKSGITFHKKRKNYATLFEQEPSSPPRSLRQKASHPGPEGLSSPPPIIKK